MSSSLFSSAFSSQDNRRFCGPAGGSRDYRDFVKHKETSDPASIVAKGKKASKKKATAPKDAKLKHREMFLRTGVLSQCSGSAYLEQGSTRIVVGVHGPREIPRRSDFSMSGVLQCRIQLSPFSCAGKRRSPMGDQDEREIGITIKEALQSTVCLHLYPKSQIDVFVTVLENDGSFVAGAITCAGLALADAAIDMFDVIVGASMRRLGSRAITDPTLEEEEEKMSKSGKSGEKVEDDYSLTVGYLPSLDQVAALLHEGTSSTDSLVSEVETLTSLCKEILPCVQQCLVQSVKNRNTVEAEAGETPKKKKADA